MKLFLCSSFSDVSNLLLDFEPSIGGKKVTFIPTASKVEKVKFYVNSAKKSFVNMNVHIDEVDLSTTETKKS